MKNVKAVVTINKPVAAVFDFAINPENTPKWVDTIAAEQTNEWPVKLGSIYHNQRQNGAWSEYEVVAFEPNKTFVLQQKQDGFYVGYDFRPAEGGVATELEYHIWSKEKELPTSLTEDVLNSLVGKFKQVVEEVT